MEKRDSRCHIYSLHECNPYFALLGKIGEERLQHLQSQVEAERVATWMEIVPQLLQESNLIYLRDVEVMRTARRALLAAISQPRKKATCAIQASFSTSLPIGMGYIAQ